MIGTLALNRRLGTLLSADATTLAPAMDANQIALVVASFTPTPATTLADLTLADDTYLAPIEGTAGAQQVGNDPVTGEQVITILEPAGGWRWELASAPPDAIVVYGYALLDNALAVYLGGQLLPAPVALASIGDFLDIGSATFRIPFAPLS